MSVATVSTRTGSTEMNDQDFCRLMLVNSTGTDIFLTSQNDQWRLPTLEIPRFSRVLDEITQRVRQTWQVSPTQLFSNYAPADGAQNFTVVLEIPKGIHSLPGLSKQPLSEATSLLHGSEDLAFLEAGSDALNHQHDNRAPFARLGWIYELENWVQQVPGVGTIVSYSQLSGSRDTCLMQFKTPTRRLWYKAIGQSDPKEFSITAALADWLPDYLPRILAFDTDRNAWLMESAGETELRQHGDFETWAAVARRLAAMQIASLPHAGQLLASGCIDARFRNLEGLVRPFFEQMGSLMQQQVKNPPAPLAPAVLSTVAHTLSTALSELGSLEIPDVIGHSDFNPGNILITGSRCAFTDWSAAHVGNPWLTLEYLIAHFKRNGAALPGQDTLLRQVYREEWGSAVSPEAMRQAQQLSPIIAVFASAVSDDTWRNPARLALPGIAGYLRSLARIMHREAKSLNARRAYA